jgi:hypothetical protein
MSTWKGVECWIPHDAQVVAKDLGELCHLPQRPTTDNSISQLITCCSSVGIFFKYWAMPLGMDYTFTLVYNTLTLQVAWTLMDRNRRALDLD